MPDGYPKMAAFLDSDENFMVYRRFGYAQSRLLLEQQDIVRRLEYQLESIDYCDTENCPSLLKSRDDFESHRKTLLADLKREWLDYCKPRMVSILVIMLNFPVSATLLGAARNMTSMNRPTTSEYRSVNNWMLNEKPVEVAERKFTQWKEDLVTLRPGREHAWLDVSVEHLLRWLHCDLIEVSGLQTYGRDRTQRG